MFPLNNINHKMTAFPKMCNYQALKNDMNLFKWAPLSSFCCHLCTLHKNLLGTIQASAVLGMCEGVSMGVMRFCMWESMQPTRWSLCPSQGLKWHVMNDFAEPEIFMHELQLYVSVLLLKATSPFWLKGCQRGHQILFLTSCWWSRQFCFFILFSQKNIVIIFKL